MLLVFCMAYTMKLLHLLEGDKLVVAEWHRDRRKYQKCWWKVQG